MESQEENKLYLYDISIANLLAISIYLLVAFIAVSFEKDPSLTWWAAFGTAAFIAARLTIGLFCQVKLSRRNWDKEEAFAKTGKEALLIGLPCFLLGLAGLLALPVVFPAEERTLGYGAFYALLGAFIGGGTGLISCILRKEDN